MSAVLGFDMVLKFANVCDISFRVENEKHRPTRQVMFSNHEKNNYSEEHYRRRSKVKTQNHNECKFIIYSKKRTHCIATKLYKFHILYITYDYTHLILQLLSKFSPDSDFIRIIYIAYVL